MATIDGEPGNGEIPPKIVFFQCFRCFRLILGETVPDWVSALNDELEEFSVKWNDLESNPE